MPATCPEQSQTFLVIRSINNILEHALNTYLLNYTHVSLVWICIRFISKYEYNYKSQYFLPILRWMCLIYLWVSHFGDKYLGLLKRPPKWTPTSMRIHLRIPKPWGSLCWEWSRKAYRVKSHRPDNKDIPDAPGLCHPGSRLRPPWSCNEMSL